MGTQKYTFFAIFGFKTAQKKSLPADL